MKKLWWLFCLIGILTLHAQSTDVTYPSLFASVTGVVKNDVLNVRSQPNYKSKKVAEIPSAHDLPLAFGVEKCKTTKNLTWCFVYPLMQEYADHFGAENKGWVNARYLSFHDRGYVLIDGKGNCDYVLECQKKKCKIVSDYETDQDHEIISIRTKWVERNRLRGESHFSAMPNDPNASGYCTDGNRIEAYLREKRLKKLRSSTRDRDPE